MDFLKMAAVLSLNKEQYDKGLDEAEKEANEKGGGIMGFLNKASDKVSKGLAVAGKVAVAATGAAITATGALVKQSIAAYAEYQQLWGGVQKLYGSAGMTLEEYAESVGKSTDQVRKEWLRMESAQDLVLRNAKQAYKTAGMSASEYMEAATSFSAALINSLGGDTLKAAELTDVAMRAISDNFNTFGGDIDSIQRAFQGFAKQNYTMLDNLKLGYGGTKTEMERLIADANEYAKSIGEAGDLSIESFADVVKAIELVQQKQGIAGTTAREAATTISGSFGMLKGAWTDLIAGMSDSDADIGQLINNVVESAKTVVKNLTPVIKQAAGALVQLIKEVAPLLSKELPGFVKEILPDVLDAASELLVGVAHALPELINVILDVIPELVSNIMDALSEEFPEFEEVFQGISDAVEGVFGFIKDNGDLIIGILEGVLAAFIGFKVVSGILTGIQMAQKALTIAQEAWVAIQHAATIAQNALNLAMSLNPIGIIIIAITALIAALVLLWQNNEEFREKVIELWEGIKTFFSETWDAIVGFFKEAWDKIVGFFSDAWDKIVGFFSGIGDWFKNRADDIKGAFSGIGDWFKDKFGEAKEKAVGAWDNVKSKFKGVWKKIKEAFKFKDARKWGKDMIENFIKGVKDMFGALGDAMGGVASKIAGFLHFSEPDVGPLSNFHTYAPDMIDLFIKGIKDSENKLTNAIADAFDFQPLIDKELTIDGLADPNAVKPYVDRDEEVKESVIINIYAAKNQNVEELAEVVSRKLNKEVRRTQEVWA